MFFATFEIERDPPRWVDLPAILGNWVQVAGGVAAIALAAWAIHYFAEKQYQRQKRVSLIGGLFIGLCLVSAACYVGFFGSLLVRGPIALPKPPGADPNTPQRFIYTMDQMLLSTAGGFFALAALVLPMFVGLARRLSLRRVGAIARLSVKEAIRQRIIYGFCLLALVFLFAPYFFSYKDEDQLRNYVQLIHTSMTPLFLVTAAFLGAFSIPTDVQRQTIHTVVTKPVEKYEIVLGRFAGYGLLLTAVLVVLTAVGLVYLVRGVNPLAAQETYKARVPVFADGLFYVVNDRLTYKGESVGREWEYRGYIHGKTAGSSEPVQYAVWAFHSLPSDLGGSQKPVTVEMTLDIFRTTRAKEGQPGVQCVMTFAPGDLLLDEDGAATVGKLERQVGEMRKAFQAKHKEIQNAVLAKELPEKETREQMAELTRKLKEELSEEFGIYQNNGVVVTDYHTQAVTVPAALLRKLAKEQKSVRSKGQTLQLPALVVLINIDSDDPYSAPQYLGAARHDLYVLTGELPFWQNFCKMMIGLWCNTMLILGVAIACSTYLSGVISLLLTMFLLGAGAVVEFIRELASGVNTGGGPYESFSRLLSRLPTASPVEKTAANTIGLGADEAFRWVLGYILNLIPDIHRFNLTDYVAEGFDISWTQVLLLSNILPMIGYLIPWAIFAYYLMNFREIANPT